MAENNRFEKQLHSITVSRALECTIEQLNAEVDEIWIISIPAEKAACVIIFFAALYLEKTNTIKFVDSRSRQRVNIERSVRAKQQQSEFTLALNGKKVSINKTWLEAVASMILDVALNGWHDTAHLDADFDNSTETVTVCIKIEPPVLKA